MYHLSDIKSTVQQTADAIAAALKIEVEIADANLIRVVNKLDYHKPRVAKGEFSFGY